MISEGNLNYGDRHSDRAYRIPFSYLVSGDRWWIGWIVPDREYEEGI
jgi:hypothetical protein